MLKIKAWLQKSVVFGAVFTCLLGMSWAASIHITDALGRQVMLPHPAQRVITLTPSLAQLAVQVGAGKQLVGVSVDTHLPKALPKVPVVGGLGQVDVEKIVALKPDIVLAWRQGSPFAQLHALRKFAIPVFYVAYPKVLSIAKVIHQIGLLTGHRERARRVAQAFVQRFNQLKQMNNALSYSPTVMLQVGANPIYVLTSKSIQGQVVKACGGRLLFDQSARAARVVTLETVLGTQPDIIISTVPGANAFWSKWSMLKAFKQKHIVTIPGSRFSQNTPALLDVMTTICQKIRAYEVDGSKSV